MKDRLIDILRRHGAGGRLFDLLAGGGLEKLRKELEEAEKRLASLPVSLARKKKGDPLNVAQLSTYDNFGGAALVGFRLHGELRRLGHSSAMLVGYKMSDDPGPVRVTSGKDRRFKTLCEREGLQYLNYLSSFDIPEIPAFRDADILQMHNLHGDYFNYRALPGLTRLKPSVWTLHDMHAVTGHCGFSLECGRWETGCGECPMPGAYPALEKDTTDLLWNEKKDIYARTDVDIVVPSKWLGDIVRKSVLGGKAVHLIYNGVDTDVFKPLDKAELRKRLDIPPDKTVLITSAAGGVKNPQKGGAYLLEALRKLEGKENIAVVSIGDKDFDPGIEGLRWINTGHLYDPKAVAGWYAASDIFIYPSLADNCPLVVLEALACGLPVVTFETGGIPELVEHMRTGYVADYKDTDGLVKGIETFLADGELRASAGERARRKAESDFTVEKMTKSYLDLYYKVIEKRAEREGANTRQEVRR